MKHATILYTVQVALRSSLSLDGKVHFLKTAKFTLPGLKSSLSLDCKVHITRTATFISSIDGEAHFL